MKNLKILRKLELKKKLTKEEISQIVNDYTNGIIKDEEMTVFLKLVYKNELSFDETVYLTEAMVNSGDIVDLSKVKRPVVDKHSTGGVGDKVSLILGPIVAACNLSIAKMSGRSLGYTGGTIDKLESIEGYNVNISEEKFIDILNKIGVSIISQTKNIAPADKKIYALRDITNTTESIPLIASSIMSKKIACASDVIVIDLKVGKGAFMKDIRSASKLAKTMIKIGKAFNKKVICILTDMNSPLGHSVGNKLEIEEVMDYFDGKRDKRLDKLVKTIASYLVMQAKNISLASAKKEVNSVIKNNQAKEIFYKWIKAQNGNLEKFKIDSEVLYIKSPKNGYIKNIDALEIAKLVCDLGAQRKQKNDIIDLNVGVKINKTLYSKVKEGDILGSIYFNKEIEDMSERFLKAFKVCSRKLKVKDVILKIKE